MNKFLPEFDNPRLHAAFFTFKEKHYVFSGWRLLEWDDGYKTYDSINEFLNDAVFDGKMLKDVVDEITEVSFDYDP